MNIRQESYGSLNFHVSQIFKLSVINLDHMMEIHVGLRKKSKKKKRSNFYLPTKSHILDEIWNKQVLFWP